MTKIVLISDTHTQHEKVVLPKGDILIFAGDAEIRNDIELMLFVNWLQSLDYNHIIWCAGNHDFHMEHLYKNNITSKMPKNIHYLCNSSIEIEGIKFWGSPFSCEFNNWAFMYPRNSLDAKKIWNQIPENLDFLITHSPPYQILDVNRQGEHCGCEVLQREVFKKKPRYHVFGHIHPSATDNKKIIDDTTFINVSLLNEEYQMVYVPVEIEYNV